jgi:NAD(P)H-dependent FMN reductase
MRILAISGSLQGRSKNLTLLTAAARLAPPDVELVLFDGLRDLPHFNPDIEAGGVPESVRRLRQALDDSDGPSVPISE